MAASTALCLSDVVWTGPVAAVTVGVLPPHAAGARSHSASTPALAATTAAACTFLINPPVEELRDCVLTLTVAGTRAGVVSLEGAAREVRPAAGKRNA